MTKEEFTKLFTEDPNSDAVMEEINRLYDSESKLTADFAAADSERTKLKSDLDTANKRYRERFLSGPAPDPDQGNPETNKIDALFKEV